MQGNLSAKQLRPRSPVGSTSMPPPVPNQPCLDVRVSTTPTPAPAAAEDTQLAMAIKASIQTAIAEGIPVTGTTNTNGWGLPDGGPSSKLGTSLDPYNGWSGVRPSSSSPQVHAGQPEASTVSRSAGVAPPSVPIPSAPPILDETFYNGPIHYPSITSSPINLTMPTTESKPVAGKTKVVRSSSSSSGSCVICLDARVEGACIPCGHMAGCMSCPNDIKANGWGCPVCRAKIDQVVKLSAV